jgi:cobalt-zinc-cadmium efflux system protein
MPHSHPHPHDTVGKIRTAFLLNLTFTVIEIIGGLLTNSVAILSDAIHDLGDSLALGLAWYLERYADKSKDRKYSYGYRRFSLLAALFNTFILIIGSIFVLSKAIPRLLNPEMPNAKGMIVFACIGILVNGLAVYRLRGSQSLNARVVMWHLLEDVLGWSAVLLVSIALLFFDLPRLDPLLSIIITGYVLFNVIRNLRKTLALFLQAVPDHIDVEAIESRLKKIDNVCSTHHTHVWSLDGEHHVLTTHIVVEENTDRQQILCIKQEVKELSDELDLMHTTIEFEYGDEICRMAPDYSSSKS